MNAFNVKEWSSIPELDKKQELPVFLYHGEADDMIKHTIANQTYQELREKGFKNFTLQTEPGIGHSLSEKEIQSLKKFLSTKMI